MKKILLFILFLSVFRFGQSQVWKHNVINYTKQVYDLNTQNWAIDQSPINRWMYFANTGGLLEFDGLYWRQYTVSTVTVRSVKCIRDRIFIGGSCEFGYFEKNNYGIIDYTSLSESLKNWQGEVWNIIDNGNYIYFQTDGSILIFDGTELKIIPSANKIKTISVIGNVVYCGGNNGIYRLEGEKLTPIQGNEILQNKEVIFLSELPNKEILIVTSEDGFYRYDKTKIHKDISLSELSFVSNNHLLSADLKKSKLAIGTIYNGAYIVDMQDYSVDNYSMSNLLQNNTILNLKFDDEDNLWLALDKGIDYVQASSPVSNLYGNRTLIGTGYGSVIKNNKLYLATNQGVYKADISHGVPNLSSISFIKETEGQTWNIYEYDNQIFCANDNGIYIITENNTQKIALKGCWQIHPYPQDKNILIAVTYADIAILKKENGIWKYAHHLGLNNSFWGMIYVDGVFWHLSYQTGISKFVFSDDLKSIKVLKEFGYNSEITENFNVRLINGNITFSLKSGIYYYNKLEDRIESYSYLENKLEGRKYYSFLDQDIFGNIWYISNNGLKMVSSQEDGTYSDTSVGFGLKSILNPRFLNIHSIDRNSIMINTEDGFSIIDQQLASDSNHRIEVFIKEVKTNTIENNEVYETLLSKDNPILNYNKNNIKFIFGATDFSKNNEILYSYRLSGFQDTWSLPGADNIKEYTSLPPGEYTFEVRLHFNGRVISESAKYHFEILPPWYKSVYAYIVYTLLFLILLFYIYKKTFKKQALELKEKNEIIKQQEEKFIEETSSKNEEINNLQNEILKKELDFKNQELTSTTLNVIRKNEMLQNIKKIVINVAKSLDEDIENKVIKRKVTSLINQIDVNLEHDNDFQNFLNTFDQYHADFFKKLDISFPNLNRNDKLLCAFSKIGLSNKEIAPLLNISIRGVEIARYRLRKKLNLDKHSNLSEFLKNL